MNCPKCKHSNPEDARFCNKCGAALTAASSPTPGQRSERKQVTILFSDMAGYTSMTERLDPEEVKTIMSRVFGQISQAIAKYDGFIERFVGDAVMAVFGIPRVHEDDPMRAIRAAMEIHALVEALSPELASKVGRPLAMHSGINTGLVVTGEVNFDKGTHGLAGDAINLAARLQGLAGNGEIVVGESTYKLAQRHFAFETLPPTKVKGKAEPVPVFKLVSGKAPEPRMSTSRQVSSVMVGREREMDRLEFQVHKAINGQGSVVNVVGEAGIGKSRLIAELKKRDVTQRVTLLEGRAISIGKNLSFHPIIDLLKHWARITEDDSEMQVFDKLERAIRAIHPQETDEILPFVATLMGLKLRGRHAERVQGIEGEALEKLIFKNFRDLIIKGSELRPMVIVMEDLHWADNSSLELLQALYRLTEKHNVLFVNVFRPGYLEEDGAKVTAEAHERIELQPLANRDSEALINNMLEIKGLPSSLKEQILVRAGGNPFFIEEVVRSLLDGGAVVMGANGFEVTDKVNRVVIPPTINEVLMARIDRLEEQTRELVKVAAVIGRSFFDRILKDVADTINGVDERLSYLKNVQLIRERKRLQELEYLFSHALAQEAAYDSTLLQQRKSLHLKVAKSIERIFQERLHEFYGMLAYHYGKAEDLDKTEEYLTKAGEEALRSSAASEALNYLRDALKLYTERYGDKVDREKIVALKKSLAQAHFQRGHYREAISCYDDILTERGHRIVNNKFVGLIKISFNLLAFVVALYVPIHHKTKPPNRQDLENLDLRFKKGQCLWLFDAKQTFSETLSLLVKTLYSSTPETSLHKEFISAANVPFIGVGYVALSNKLIKRAEYYIGDQNGIWSLPLASAKILLAYRTGKWETVPEIDHNLLEIANNKGEQTFAILYLYGLSNTRVEQGDWGRLDLYAQHAQFIADSYDIDLAQVLYHNIKTITFIRKGYLDKALIEAKTGAALTNKLEFTVHHLRSIGFKLIAQALVGELEQAEVSIQEGESLIAKQKAMATWYLAPFFIGKLLTHLELLKNITTSPEKLGITAAQRTAYKSAQEAFTLTKKYAPYRTWILRLLGDYHWLIGKQGKALKWWGKSIHEGERLGARPDLSRTYFEVGKRLLEPGSTYKQLNGIDAEGYLAKARSLFGEMDLQRDLDELDKIMPGV